MLHPFGTFFCVLAFGHDPNGGIEQGSQKKKGDSYRQRVQMWYESDDPENARFLGYDKVKFTVVMPDGTTYTERQDIGDGDGGVLDFLAQYPKYQDILPLLQQSTPPQNDYMLLSRLKADCDYFLGAGGRA